MTGKLEVSPAPSADCGRLLIGAKDLARLLSIGTRSVWRMESAAKLPRGLNVGRLRRWRLAEIEAWTAAGCPDRTTWEAQNGGHGGRK